MQGGPRGGVKKSVNARGLRPPRGPVCYCIYMDKDTQGRGQKGRDKLGELWRLMEKTQDPTEFTLLCEEFAREGGVKAL